MVTLWNVDRWIAAALQAASFLECSRACKGICLSRMPHVLASNTCTPVSPNHGSINVVTSHFMCSRERVSHAALTWRFKVNEYADETRVYHPPWHTRCLQCACTVPADMREWENKNMPVTYHPVHAQDSSLTYVVRGELETIWCKRVDVRGQNVAIVIDGVPACNRRMGGKESGDVRGAAL